MPSFIVDGEPHQVPFMPFFRGYRSCGKKWFAYNAKIVSIALKFCIEENIDTFSADMIGVAC
jgi:hypothetical protein